MNNLISVIVPVYNGELFLERCLDSILSQTYNNLEIIVVNDGSTDLSAKIIDRYSKSDRRIVAIHQQNKGVSSARNMGIRNSSGEFIGFVDGDDEILPDMYEFLLNNLLKYNADISHCGFELVKNDKLVKFHDTGVFLEQNKFQGLSEILSGQKVEPSTCNKLYKKAVLSNIKFPEDIKNNEDLLFNVEAFYKSEKTVFEDVVKYRYFHHSDSASRTSFTEKKAQDIYEVAARIKNLLTEDSIQKNCERFYISKLLTIIKSLKQNDLYNTEVSKKIRAEVATIDTRKMGLRIYLTKLILVRFPFLYNFTRYIYDLFFIKNQKWKNHS